MANQGVIDEFFASVDVVMREMSRGDAEKEKLLREFFVSVLSILDGVEGRDVRKWNGIALVARGDGKGVTCSLDPKRCQDPFSPWLAGTSVLPDASSGALKSSRLFAPAATSVYTPLSISRQAATLDLSESRVSQMHSAILDRLKHQLNTRHREFLKVH